MNIIKYFVEDLKVDLRYKYKDDPMRFNGYVIACAYNSLDVVKYLKNIYEKNNLNVIIIEDNYKTKTHDYNYEDDCETTSEYLNIMNYAIKNENIDVVKYLINKKTIKNNKNCFYQIFINECKNNTNLKKIQHYHKEFLSLIKNEKDEFIKKGLWYQILHAVVYNSNMDIIMFIMEHPSLNIKYENLELSYFVSLSTLEHAIFAGKQSLIKYLLEIIKININNIMDCINNNESDHSIASKYFCESGYIIFIDGVTKFNLIYNNFINKKYVNYRHYYVINNKLLNKKQKNFIKKIQLLNY